MSRSFFVSAWNSCLEKLPGNKKKSHHISKREQNMCIGVWRDFKLLIWDLVQIQCHLWWYVAAPLQALSLLPECCRKTAGSGHGWTTATCTTWADSAASAKPAGLTARTIKADDLINTTWRSVGFFLKSLLDQKYIYFLADCDKVVLIIKRFMKPCGTNRLDPTWKVSNPNSRGQGHLCPSYFCVHLHGIGDWRMG